MLRCAVLRAAPLLAPRCEPWHSGSAAPHSHACSALSEPSGSFAAQQCCRGPGGWWGRSATVAQHSTACRLAMLGHTEAAVQHGCTGEQWLYRLGRASLPIRLACPWPRSPPHLHKIASSCHVNTPHLHPQELLRRGATSIILLQRSGGRAEPMPLSTAACASSALSWPIRWPCRRWSHAGAAVDLFNVWRVTSIVPGDPRLAQVC